MFYWSQIPLVRLVLPFILGILFSSFISIEEFISIEVLVILCISLFIFSIIAINGKYKFRYLSGILIYLILFFIGTLSFFQHNKIEEIQSLNSGKKVLHTSVIEEILKSDSTKSTIILSLNSLNVNEVKSRNFKYILYAKGNYLSLKIGDVVSHNSILNDLPTNQIPSQFNYSDYLNKKGVYAQSNTNSLIKLSDGSSIYQVAENIRNEIEAIYKKVGIRGDNLSVLIALTLGDKSLLDMETKSSFSHVGAMHILAVSGLHVGIVYLIFNYVLGFMGKSKTIKTTRAVLLLLVVWLFCFLTGFSPSVQRAGCMFSIIIVANALSRSTYIMNSIFGSAFLLLIVNPNNLFSVGFQLSYSAVIGIVLIYPILRIPFISSYKFLNKVVDISVVSISAQLATLPFALYYFHLFPNWFVLSNLFVIPIAFALVSLSLLLVLVFLCFQSALGIGVIINFLLDSLLFLISLIKELPYPMTDDIWIEPTTALLLGLLIWGFVYYLYFPSNRLRYGMLTILIAITLLEISENINQQKQTNLFIYPFSQHIVSKIQGNVADVITYNDSISDYNKFLVVNHLKSIGADSLNFTVSINSKNDYSTKLKYDFIEFKRKIIIIPKTSDWPELIPLLDDNSCFYLPNNYFLFNNLKENRSKVKLLLNSNLSKIRREEIQEKFPNAEIVESLDLIKL